jgi:4-amino-4-deoxy-L-arabinose transferase-like glycosyltransferase
MAKTTITEKFKEVKINMLSWVSENRFEALLLAVILLAGALFRLYRIDEYMTFLGDEGRDAIIMRRLWADMDFFLIGPRTSIGDMYLGPLYYYMAAPFLLFANFSPAGPSIMVALIGVLTVFMVWRIGREWFGSTAGIVASLLYAISPVAIIYSRSSWNPNIMPFFALLSIYSVWKIWKNDDWKWLIYLGIFLAFVLQSHYLGLLLLPTVGFFWLLSFIKVKNENRKLYGFLKNSLLGIIVFTILMSPLVIFDARHGWRNFTAMKKFFLERQTTVSARPWTAVPEIPEISFQTNASIIGAGDTDLTWLFTYSAFAVLVYIFAKEISGNSKKLTDIKYWSYTFKELVGKRLSPFFLLTVWLFVAYIGLGLYKQHIYDHYFGFFFTAPPLLIGGMTQYIKDNFAYWWKPFLFVFFIYAIYVNVANSPLKYPPNKQMQRAIAVAEKIQDESGGKPLNLAVVAERNYEDGYKYFLEKWGEPVIDIDPQKSDETITGQLFVVCELPRVECDPTHNPKAEVANFGWSKITGEWEVAGTTVYRLVHSS